MVAVSMFRLAITVWQGAREEWQVRTAGPLGRPWHWFSGFCYAECCCAASAAAAAAAAATAAATAQQQQLLRQLFHSPVCFIPLCFKPHGSACVSCHRPLQDTSSHNWPELCALWGLVPIVLAPGAMPGGGGGSMKNTTSAVAGSCSVLCVVLWRAVWLHLCG